MTPRRSSLIGSLALVAMLAVSSCGSDSSTDATGTGSTTTTADDAGATSGAADTTTPATASTAVSTTTGSGAPGAPPNGGGGGSSDVSYASSDRGLTLDGGSDTRAAEAYSADGIDESAVLVSGGGRLTLDEVDVSSSSVSSSSDGSSFYGLDAGVLAVDSSTITMNGGSVTTTGDGANGIFATGDGSSLVLDGVTISATGQYAHGIMATQGASIDATDLDVTTAGASSATVATDRGGGTISVTGGTFHTTGYRSPGLYSTGTLVVTGGTYTADAAEAAVIEGSNTITVTDADLVAGASWGVLLYQSFSGDAQGSESTFTMTGGSLTAAEGPLFHVTNATGTVVLDGVELSAASGVLLHAGADQWGTEGSNGGIAVLLATAQTMSGDVTLDAISTVSFTLSDGSTLIGTVNGDDGGGTVAMVLDDTSTWTLTGDSYVTTIDGLAITGTSVTNVIGNGHTLFYDASGAANSSLGGGTYTLSGGGTLTPA
jgi:hypothetical protein